MVRFELKGFRRFERAGLDVDAPVVALVGPNEAGKTSLLDALVQLNGSAPFDAGDITQGYSPKGRLLDALYRLDEDDRTAVAAIAPDAPKVRWYRVWREAADGKRSHDTIPTLRTSEALPSTHWQTIPRAFGVIEDLADHAPPKLMARVRETKSKLPDNSRDYTEGHLATLDQLVNDLADTGNTAAVKGLEQMATLISDFAKAEKKHRLPDKVLSLLQSRVPPVLEFSEGHRTLHSEYDLHNRTWTNGLLNLARLAGFDLNRLREFAAGNQPQLYVGLIRDANARIDEYLENRWGQAKVTVRLEVDAPHRLRLFAEARGGGVYQLKDRSDGLRTFVALVAFLAETNTDSRPMLVVDAADSHLHWDAQADLVNLFHTQDAASQIIYATHSPGCLPHDLGHGVRAVVPDPEHPDRSYVKNRIWESDAGYRPLLLVMGASTAALTPHRFAVATEGTSDFILLPSLLREATGQHALPFQIVPGLAQLARSDIPRIDGESDAVVYLTDGDKAGKDIRTLVKGAGVPERRILQLPEGITIEDLVAGDTLTTAVYEELDRSGREYPEDLALPPKGRAVALAAWYKSNGLGEPNKRAIACRVLDLTADNPTTPRRPLIEEMHRGTLKTLYTSLTEALNCREQSTHDPR